jgi:hypothetical protein
MSLLTSIREESKKSPSSPA